MLTGNVDLPKGLKKHYKIGYLMQTHAPDMFEVSGAQSHVRSVIQAMRACGHAVRLVAIQKDQILRTDDLVEWQPVSRNAQDHSLFSKFEALIRFLQNKLHLPFFRFFDSLHFSNACIQELAGYDFLYERFGLLNYGGLIAARRLKIPIVIEVNGDIVEEYAHHGIHLSKIQWSVIHLISQLTFKYCSHVVAVDEGVKERLISRWQVDPRKINVIMDGTEYELFSRPRDSAAIKETYRLQDEKIVAYVGGFKPWHGVDILVRAFKTVHEEIPNALLVLMGDGPERPLISALVEQVGLTGAVVFLGRLNQDKVAEVLSISDVATAPYHNWRDVLGLKTLDYMASGRAIVTSSKNGGHPVLKHLETGMLVDPGDEKQLSDAILLLLRDDELRCEMGKNAQIQASLKHTWTNTVNQILQICENYL